MKHILAFFVALGLVSLGAGVSAAPTSHFASAQLAAAATCASGETYVKGYKKADGTAVSGYCRHSAASSKECSKSETYVHGYTKADGTQVKGYCRKQASPAM